MADEDVAPSRAEIDAVLWALSNLNLNEEQIRTDVVHYLHNRGVSDRGISMVLGDLHTYKNYPVGNEDAVS